jgi:hypothetical protein
MKLKTIIISAMAALSLGFAVTSVIASNNNYYPPERVHCLLEQGRMDCEGFSHQYLVEDTYTADLDDSDQVFSFASGAAYYNADKSEANVFFTYRNSNNKIVKLRSAVTSIRPDFENGNWTKVQNDLYVCKDGYMHCPITSLPSRR